MRTGTKWLIALSATLIAAVLLIPSITMGALGMGRMGNGMMGSGMMGNDTMGGCAMAGSGMASACPAGGMAMMADNGWMQGLAVGLSGLATLALWALLILAVVQAVRWLTARSATETEPLTILQRRYAAGEIDGITYAEMRAALNA